MGVELPLHVVVTILECCVTFSGVKLSIRSFVLFIYYYYYYCCLFGAEAFEKEFSIMTVVKWGVNRLVDVLCQMSDCFDLVYDVGEGRVWV